MVRIIKLYFNKNLVGDCDLVNTTSFLSDVLTGSISEVPSCVTAPPMSHINALMLTANSGADTLSAPIIFGPTLFCL